VLRALEAASQHHAKKLAAQRQKDELASRKAKEAQAEEAALHDLATQWSQRLIQVYESGTSGVAEPVGLRRGEFRAVYSCIEGVTLSQVDTIFDAHTRGPSRAASTLGSVGSRMTCPVLAGFLFATFKGKPQGSLEKAATSMLARASTAQASARSLTARGEHVSTRSRLMAAKLLACFDTDGVLGLEEFATVYLLVPGTEPGHDAVEAAFAAACMQGSQRGDLSESGLGSFLEARLGSLEEEEFEQVIAVLLGQSEKARGALHAKKKEKERSRILSRDRCFLWSSRLVKVCDRNGDGLLGREEFRHIYTSMQSLVPAATRQHAGGDAEADAAYEAALGGEETEGGGGAECGLNKMTFALYLDTVLSDALPDPEFLLVVERLMEMASDRAYSARGGSQAEPARKGTLDHSPRVVQGEASVTFMTTIDPPPADWVRTPQKKKSFLSARLGDVTVPSFGPAAMDRVGEQRDNAAGATAPAAASGASTPGKRSLLSQRISRLASVSPPANAATTIAASGSYPGGSPALSCDTALSLGAPSDASEGKDKVGCAATASPCR